MVTVLKHGTPVVNYFQDLYSQSYRQIKLVSISLPGMAKESFEKAALGLLMGSDAMLSEVHEPSNPKILVVPNVDNIVRSGV